MSPHEQKEESSRFEFNSLPPVTGLEDVKTRQRVVALLELLDHIVVERTKLEEQEDACKLELEELQRASDKTGFRYGLLCFAAQQVKGRKTLDKMALIENGCPAAVIEKSYKESAPSVRRTFKRLPEE